MPGKLAWPTSTEVARVYRATKRRATRCCPPFIRPPDGGFLCGSLTDPAIGQFPMHFNGWVVLIALAKDCDFPAWNIVGCKGVLPSLAAKPPAADSLDHIHVYLLVLCNPLLKRADALTEYNAIILPNGCAQIREITEFSGSEIRRWSYLRTKYHTPAAIQIPDANIPTAQNERWELL
jgi:hypothetical protein